MMQADPKENAAPWRPPGSGTPLVAWSARQLEALGAAIGDALTGWQRAWGLPVDPMPTRCEPATASAVLRDGWRSLRAGGQAWLHAPSDEAAHLGSMLFRAGGGAVARDVAQACASDAMDRLAAALHLEEGLSLLAAPPPGLGQAWSGALQAGLPGSPGWSLLLGAEAVQAWCRHTGTRAEAARPATAREPLCSAAEAVDGRPLPFTVELTGCELHLGELQDLRVGDVVRLDHELQAPARVVDVESRALFDGFLVSRQGRLAIELARRQSH